MSFDRGFRFHDCPLTARVTVRVRRLRVITGSISLTMARGLLSHRRGVAARTDGGSEARCTTLYVQREHADKDGA
jgi:hypothetical protein